ncbi:MAG: LysR family transcriptional regulator [Proteobacteria bacterium]|uniref:LysR substrate-binding domain-containing protein n=1 Tax=Aquabacterium sp. TaxID=1872578 RepID=UPI0035C69B41|nr:LysR family transcriptional regulator [Pseudomonadota bacterium]
MAPPPVHRIRLQHVRCLLATATHGNMKAAAEALSITQPAVTKIIKELEDVVGQPLVQRLRHGVCLTPAGERFARHARQGVSALEDALLSVDAPEAGPVRLGVLPTLAVGWVHDVLVAWRGRGMAGAVQVVTGRNSELLTQLQRGELDVVLGRLAEPDRMMALRFEPLWAEPMVAAMAPDHPLAPAPGRGWGEWRDWRGPVVLPLPGTGIRQAADAFVATLDWPHPHPQALETLVVPIARQMALQDGAVWFSPLSTVREDLASGLLVGRALPGAATEAVGMFTQAVPVPAGARAAALCEVVRDAGLAWRHRCQEQLAALGAPTSQV